MKKLFILFSCVFFFNFYCKAQFVDIPDDFGGGFREFLMAKYPACFNAAGQMDTTCSAITTEDSLSFVAHGANVDLRAIQYFDALQYFDLSNYTPDYFVTVHYPPDMFPSTLLTLNIHNARTGFVGAYLAIPPSIFPAGLQSLTYTYTYFDFASTTWPAGLKYLNIDYGGCVNSLGGLPPTLEYLSCRHQQIDPDFEPSTIQFNPSYGFETLHSLPALPAGLIHFDCGFNGLLALPALPAGLTWLDCSSNYTRYNSDPGDTPIPLLGSLPTLPAGLVYLRCSGDKLTGLPTLPSSLVYLDCSNNKYYLRWDQTMTTHVIWAYAGIGNLPVLPPTLQYLNCGGNNLASLPALPPVLNDLDFDALNNYVGAQTFASPGNHVSVLPALPQTLMYLNCKGNTLTCLPHLPASMSGQSAFNNDTHNLILDYTQINCIPNSVPGMRVAGAWPLCNVTNNTNACEIDPIIGGNAFYDNNSNGVQDAGELPKANVQVNYSTGLQTFTDINGHYEGTAAIGSNTITIVPPVFYNAVPATLTHTVSAPNTFITDLIALQPNTLIDSLKITITGPATIRRGFDVDYYVKYENVGTTILNAAIVINYFISNGISYSGSTNSSVVDNGGSLTLGLNNFQPGQHGSFNIRFAADFTVTSGGGIASIATISGGSSFCSDSAGCIVVVPYDPNEKQATHSLTTQQVADGKYINYTILFQNTGTASALNVFLTDTLSALLQANTLQMVESSHACRISRAGNKLLFEFVNINLPDSNANEPASHGYVRFRIKPLITLTSGTIIPNRASIYFDFNSAVLTNTAITNIDAIVVPVKLSSFNVRKQNATVQLFWSTEQESNSKSFVIERSSTGNKWDEVTTVPAAGNSAQKIYYTTTDFNPAKGVNYYRLKQIDLDGKFNYSEIRSVYFSNDINIVLVPNPASDKVTVYLPGITTMTTISIFNVNGQLMKTISTEDESIQINLSGFSKGVYTIKLSGKNINEVRKLLLQ